MWDWNSDRIQNLVKNVVAKSIWRTPQYEQDDLQHEAWFVYQRVSERYTAASIRAKLGDDLSDDRVRAVWYSLLRTSLWNAFVKLGRSDEEWVMKGDVILRDPWGTDAARAIEIACDLEHTPGLRHLLARSSWEDGAVRIRTARLRKDGRRETDGEIMQRLAGRRCVRDFEAELRRVV